MFPECFRFIAPERRYGDGSRHGSRPPRSLYGAATPGAADPVFADPVFASTICVITSEVA